MMAPALLSVLALAAAAPLTVKTDAGLLEGTTGTDASVHVWKGIPYAAPPVGDRRWKAPEPAAPWTGVRKADAFGARCMQTRVFEDIVFRDEQSEDCLYLNVWAPAAAKDLPVMVWIHGGGFVAGSASEPRQDGERLARKGVVVVGLNYRLGSFGFMAHPELTKESSHGASGNYGLLDQIAALAWVKRNIAAFGGDPDNVTIFGESAGSFAVSALMVAPPAQGLFHKVIGESGAFFTAGEQTLSLAGLAKGEESGRRLATQLGADSLTALRAKPAEEVLKAAATDRMAFRPIIDGYVLTQDAYTTFAAGKQARVPLLAGWNRDEIRQSVTLAPVKPTPRTFADAMRERFGAGADALLKVYPAANDAEALESAASLASDMFIGYATWKWIEMHEATGHAPVYRFSFDRVIPVPVGHNYQGVPIAAKDVGARHAGEIEYVFGTLDWQANVPWEPADRAVSDLMMTYWSNFAKSGDPNGTGLPAWPRYREDHAVMHLDGTSQGAPDALRARYQALDAYTDTLRKK